MSLLPFRADDSMNDDLRSMVWRGHYLGYGPADVPMHVPVDRPLMEANPQVAMEAMPSPRAPRDGWANGLAVKSDANDFAQALQVAMNQLGQSGRLGAIFAAHNVAWRAA